VASLPAGLLEDYQHMNYWEEKPYGIKILKFYELSITSKDIVVKGFYGRVFLFEHDGKTGMAYCVSHRREGVEWNVGIVKYSDPLVANMVLKKFINALEENDDLAKVTANEMPLDSVVLSGDWVRDICKTVRKRHERVFNIRLRNDAWEKIKTEVGGIY
jgi:hypothetical protein